jgi:hypothetical protein
MTGPKAAQPLLGPVGGDAEDQPVRTQGVVHGVSLTQELRVPGEFDVLPRGCEAPDEFGEPRRRPHGHRGLAHHQRPPVQPPGQLGHGTVHIAQIGGVRVRLLRGADADEVHVAEVRGLVETRPEPQAAGVERLGQQFRQARLEEGHPARVERVDLRLVRVHAEDVEAQDGHADGMGGTQIAGAYDGEAGSRLTAADRFRCSDDRHARLHFPCCRMVERVITAPNQVVPPTCGTSPPI